MTKTEYLKSLNKSLKRLTKQERARTVSYYGELIDDRVENGISEQEAVAELGSTAEIAEQLLNDAAEQGNLKPQRHPVNTVLLIIGSPIWFSLLVAAVVILLAVYVVVWAVIVSLAAVELSLALTGLAGVLGTVIYIGRNAAAALLLFGCGLICASLALFLFYPLLKLVKQILRGTTVLWKKFWNAVIGKVGVKA